MNAVQDYYLSKLEELKILSDTYKCKTSLMRNVDTGEVFIKKEMGKKAYQVYKDLKEISNIHIAKIFECFVLENKCITIEEYINGRSLESLIGEEGLSPEKAINYAVQLCKGLMSIHEKGIVHRDIRPDNIIINSEGKLKLIDFDIAREEKSYLERDTELLGTAGYAPPEQYGFAQTDKRSDIYSIGIVLKEMALGKTGEDRALFFKKIEVQNRHGGIKINAKLLLEAIDKCTEIDPKNRFENVLQLKNILLQCKEESSMVSSKVNELPPLTVKNIFASIPGFKNGNVFLIILSILIHLLFISALVEMGLEVPVEGWKKAYSVVISILYAFVPYLYFANIGQIAQRFPKKEFKSKAQRIRYQILYGFIVFIVIAIIIDCTLPLTPKN